MATYWLGMSRSTRSASFAFADNTTISVQPADVPYLHWNWLTPNRRIQDMNCVEARWVMRVPGGMVVWRAGHMLTRGVLLI